MPNDDNLTQLQLFPDDSGELSHTEELQLENAKSHYREVSKTHISLRAEQITVEPSTQEVYSSFMTLFNRAYTHSQQAASRAIVAPIP